MRDAIETTTRDSPEAAQWMSVTQAALVALDLLAIGVLLGLVWANRLLVSERAVYGETNMAAASVVLDLLDAFLLPVVVAVSAVIAISALALLLTLLRSRKGTLKQAAAAGLLGALLVVAAIWFGAGRSHGVDAVVPITPTPVAASTAD